jgi:AraC-like DNA-binding protein
MPIIRFSSIALREMAALRPADAEMYKSASHGRLALSCFSSARGRGRVNRVQTIFLGASARVERFDHPEHCAHRDEGPEVTDAFVVTFLERGGFELDEGGRRWSFGPLDVLQSSPGIARTYRHREACPADVCLSVCFAPDAVEDALGRLPQTPFPPRVPAGPASRFAHARVLRALRSGDAMAVETAAFDCAVAMGPHRWEGPCWLESAAAHARRIERACEAMTSRLGEDHSLASAAREAGLSVFYFARVFRELVGESPHQYLLRARLAHAARMLRSGASVTEAAFGSGFANLSHFTRTFGRRFGVAPAEFARRRRRAVPDAAL